MKSILQWSKLLCIVLLSACTATPTPQPPVTATTPPPVAPQETRVSFVGVGDNLIHETIYLDAAARAKAQGKEGYDFVPMYERMMPFIQEADIAFLNQETILGGDDRKLSGYPSFNSPSCLADQMIAVGFTMFNQASNHSMDKGKSGIEHAATLWRDKMQTYSIIMSGVYDSLEDRNTIRTLKVKGITFSLLSYTYGTNGIKVPNAYLVPLLDKQKIKEDVARAKEVSDVVLVSVQWGTENVFKPNAQQKEYAKYFNSLGVDVVIGHHPHTIQPIEWLTNEAGEKTLVTYSLGNFIGGMLNWYNSLGGMVGMDFVRQPGSDEVTVENVTWRPFVIHFDGNPNNIMKERYNYEVIPLSQYTNEMAKRHALNGYEGQSITIETMHLKTKEVIAETAVILGE